VRDRSLPDTRAAAGAALLYLRGVSGRSEWRHRRGITPSTIISSADRASVPTDMHSRWDGRAGGGFARRDWSSQPSVSSVQYRWNAGDRRGSSRTLQAKSGVESGVAEVRLQRGRKRIWEIYRLRSAGRVSRGRGCSHWRSCPRSSAATEKGDTERPDGLSPLDRRSAPQRKTFLQRGRTQAMVASSYRSFPAATRPGQIAFDRVSGYICSHVFAM